MQLTAHARDRAAQRSIPTPVIEAIYAFGTDYASAGAIGLRLDRRALELAADELATEELARLRRFIGVYLISQGDRVITVARANRRRIH